MFSHPESWDIIVGYLEQGLSVIPARDRDEVVGNRVYAAKTPYSSWTRYQKEIVKKDFLWHELDKYNTESVAIVCGKVSGGLYVIDFDVKHKPGIDSQVLKNIQEYHPEIYEKLRKHRTKSVGLHLLYRVNSEKYSGNTKIAGRPTTDEEKEAYKTEHPEVKKELKELYFIEMRGEGGYVLAPPSKGYSVLQDIPIQTLTEDEHNIIINICKNYNEIIKPPKEIKTSAKELDYFDENPFTHYSRSGDATELLEDFGWKYESEKGLHIYYTRPGKDRGVSASFNKETRIFWTWSSNTDFEQEKGYHLSNILVDIKFNGDKKQAFAWLTNKGFGKVKAKIEQRSIIHKANAGEPLPKNFSEEAREGYEQLLQHLKELHPYGTFWDIDEDDNVEISRKRFYEVSEKMGFRFYLSEVYQIIGLFIYKREPRFFYDTMNRYIKLEDEKTQEAVFNAYEGFLQRSGEFTIKRLRILEEEEIMYDTKEVCCKFYKDVWVKITSDKEEEIQILEYDALPKLVFAERVQNRLLKFAEKGKFIEFLEKACALSENRDYICKILGSLAHEYIDDSISYIFVLTEQVVDPKEGGGTGKNLLCEMLRYITTFISKPGKQVKYDEKFFQMWNGERVFAISDIPKDFDFEFLKELSSGRGIQKKLFKDEYVIPRHNMPKFVCQTQFSFEIKDGGEDRRIRPLEFTNFFTLQGGVDVYFGCLFPTGWTEDDWGAYDAFMLHSIQLWLRSGCKIEKKKLSDTGWIKQFNQKFGLYIPIIIETYWNTWLERKFISNDDFNAEIEAFYNNNGVNFSSRPTRIKLNNAIQEYALHNDVLYESDVYNNVNSKGKGRRFTVINEEETPF